MKKQREMRPVPKPEEPKQDDVLQEILAVLKKIEKHLKPDNAKIDPAGGTPNVK